jgi:RNA polymerase sigma-19 factor, ECF subfamily
MLFYHRLTLSQSSLIENRTHFDCEQVSIHSKDISHGILKDFKNGSPDAFQKIFELHYRKFVYFAGHIIKDRDQAEDIVSESFLKVWERREKINDVRALINYLQVTVRNGCINYLNSKRRHDISHLEISYLNGISEEEIQTAYIRSELLELSWTAAEALPPATKKVFQLLFDEGLSMKEAAEKLGVSINTIKTQRLSALRYLKEIASRNNWILFIVLLLL